MSASHYLGVDDEGRCLGCRKDCGTLDPDCPVCMADVETLGEWGEDGVDPKVATERLRKALAELSWVACPKCGGEVQDFDGFGVLVHNACGYCSHPDIYGNSCTNCGQTILLADPA